MIIAVLAVTIPILVVALYFNGAEVTATKNIAPPLIKVNSTRNTTDVVGNCNLFPGDASCVHNPTYNITANNTTTTHSSKNVTAPAVVKNVTKAPPINNTSEPSIKITAINASSSSPQTNNTNTTTTTTSHPMNITSTSSTSTNTTSVPRTNTTKLPSATLKMPATNTQAHQCPDGSFADANASCVA